MTNNTRRFKLEYTDNNANTQIIAELGQNTGALAIDRFAHYLRSQDPDILKNWLEGQNFGEAIPTRKSEYGTAENGTDEPEILLKQYNPDSDSFELKNRFYAKNTGSINEDGELAWKLYSFMKYTESQQVNVSSVSDTNGNGAVDIEDAMNAVLPDGYVADVPNDVTPPEIEGYSINARREKAFQELTRDYDWTITFTAELDANNDYKVKYEPKGYGGTVDTIVSNEQSSSFRIQDVDTTNDIFTVAGDQTDNLVVNQAIEVTQSTGNDGTYIINNLSYNSTDNQTDITVDENVSDPTSDGVILPGGQAKFKNWEKDKTDSIVNKVKVVGTDRNNPNNQIEKTATNNFMLNEFGEKFKQIKVGYLNSSAHAQKIAESYLVPGKDDSGNDIEQVPESGTVKTTVYSDNVVNDSFQVVDNTRNISDTYTCVAQRNYWPEGASHLEFEFEQEKLEAEARDKENLRDERARLYPSTNKSLNGETGFTQPGVAGNTGDTSPDVAGNTGDTSPDVAGNTGDTGPNVLGTSDNDGGSTEIAASDSSLAGEFAPKNGFVTLASFTGDSSDTEGATAYIGLSAEFEDDTFSGSPGDVIPVLIDIVVRNTTEGTDIPSTFVTVQTIHTFIDANQDSVPERITSSTINIGIEIPENTSGNDYEVRLQPRQYDMTFGGVITFVEYDQHSHGSGTYDADLHPHDDGTLDADNHPHDDGTLDADNHPHDDGTLDADNHPHQSGSLEAEVAEENKTDR